MIVTPSWFGQVVITAAQGGHQAPVKALLPYNTFLISADFLGTIKVWDMASGQCVQTIQQAHTNAIMGLLNWEVGHHWALSHLWMRLIWFFPCVLLSQARLGVTVIHWKGSVHGDAFEILRR
jgi:WD40 repeat protein